MIPKRYGDWWILDLPEPEQSKIIQQRIQEFRKKYPTHCRIGKGYHNNPLPGLRARGSMKRAYMEAYR